MNICFVLPVFTRQPQGGYKMVFEYANRFVKKGHNVDIIFINEDALKQYKIPRLIRTMGASLLTKIEPRWFELDKTIKKVSGLGKKIELFTKKMDVCIATSVDTVEYVQMNFKHCKKVIFIQGYETWICDERTVHNSYKLGWKNIVISDWLRQIVDKESGYPSVLIRNPLDLDIYRICLQNDQRRKHSISILYHNNKMKGLSYAIEALYKLKERYTDLEVEMFGIIDRPREYPQWIHYTKGATQQQTVEIYNKTQVFLCATIHEGYGLTGLEAMACGTVLVSTDYQGVHEYAMNGYNALLSPVKDVQALVDNVCKVFDDDKLRDKLVQNGLEHVRDFSWDNAVEKFMKVIEE